MPLPDNKRQKRGRPQDLRSALGLGKSSLSVPTEQFMPQLPSGSRNVFIEPSAKTVDQGSQISFGNMTPGPSSGLEILKGVAGGIQSGVQAYNQVNRYTTQKQQKEIDDILMDEEVLVQYQMDSEDKDKLRGGVKLRDYADSQRGQIVNNSTLRKNSAEYRSMQKELADFLAGKEGVVDPGFRLVEDPSRTFGLMHDRLQSAMGNFTADAKRYARGKIGELSQKAQIDYSRDQVRDLNNDYSAAKNIADQLAVINKYKEQFVPGTDEHDRLMELEAKTEASHYDLREQTLINGVVDDFAGRWQGMGNDERRAIPDNWLLNSVLEDGTIGTFLDVERQAGEKDDEYAARVEEALGRGSALMARLEREDKKYRNERFELERKAVEEMEATQLQGVVERFSSGGYATRLEMLENGSYAVALERIYKAEHAGTPAPNGYLERKRTEAVTAMVTDAADDGSLNALLSELGIDMDMPPEQQIERAVYILNKGQKKVAYDKDEARLTYAKYLQDEEDMIRNQAMKRGWNPTDDQLPDDLLDELQQLNAEKDRFTSASPKEQEQILTQLGFGAPSHDPDAALDDLVNSPKVSGWITSQYDKSVQEEENKYSRVLKEWAETNALSPDPVNAPSFSEYVGANGFAVDALMAKYGSSASFTVLNQEKDFLAYLADLVSEDGDIPDQDPEEQFNMIMERVIPNAGQRRQAYRNLREAMSKQAKDYALEKKAAEQNQQKASAQVRQQREDELVTRNLISTRSVGVVPTGDSNQNNAQRIVNVTVGSHILQNVAERISSPTGLMTTSAVFTSMTDDEMDMFLTSLGEGKAEGITAVFGGMAERMKDNPDALLELQDLTLLFNAQRFNGENLRPGLFKSPVGRQLAGFAFADLLAADAVGRQIPVPGMTNDITGAPFTFGVKVTDDWKSKIRGFYNQDIREPLRNVSQGTRQGRREFLESSKLYGELILEYNAKKAYHAELQRTGDKRLARDLERRYRSNAGLELSWSVIEDSKTALGLDDQTAVGLYMVSTLFPDGTIREGDDALVDMAMDLTLGTKGFTASYGREYDRRFDTLRSGLATVLKDRDQSPETILNGLYAVAIGVRDGDTFDTARDSQAGDGKPLPLSKQFDTIRPNLKGLIPGSQDLSDEDFDSLVLSLITADEGIVDMGLIPALSLLNQDSQGIVRNQDINPEHFFRILLSGAQLADGRYAVPHADGGAVLVPPSHMLAPAKLELPNGNTLALSHDTRAGLRTVTDGRLLFSIIENPSNFQFDSQQELEDVQRVMEDYVGWLGESGYMNGGMDIVTAVLASEDIVRQVLGSNNNDRVAALPVPEGFKDRTVYSPYAMGPGVTASLTVTADGREIRFPDPTLLAERFTAGAVFGQEEQGFVAGASGQQRLYGLNPDNQQEESNRNEYALMVGDRNYIVGIGDNATFGSGEYVGEYSLNSPMGSLMYLENQLEEAAQKGLSTEGANSVAVGRLSFPGQAPMNLRDVTAENAILVRDQLTEQSHHNIVQQMVSEGYFETDDKGNVININQYVETDDGFVSAQVRLRELMHTPKLTIRYLENLVTPGQQEGELFFEAPRSGASGEPGKSILDTGILIPQEGGIKVDPKFGGGRAFNPYFTAPQHKKITKIEGAKVLPVRGDRFPMPQGESRVYIESADGHRDVTTDWDIFGLSIGGTPTNSVRDMTRYYNPNGSLRPQVGRVGIEERLPSGPRTSGAAVGAGPQLNTEGTLVTGTPVQRLPSRVDFASPENKPIYDYIRKNHPEVEFNRMERAAPGPGFEGSMSIYASNVEGNELARIMINASAFAHRANLGLESSDMPGANEARARFDYDGSSDLPPLALGSFIRKQQERLREAAGAMGPPRTTPDTGGAPEGFEERQRAIVAMMEGDRPKVVIQELEDYFDSFSTDPGDFGNISFDQAPMVRAEQKRRLTKLKNIEEGMNAYLAMGSAGGSAEHFETAQAYANRYAKVLDFYERVPLDQYIQYLDKKKMLPPGYNMSIMGTVFEDRPVRGRNPYEGE